MGNCLIAQLPNDPITDDQGEALRPLMSGRMLTFPAFHTVSRIHVLAGAPMPNVLHAKYLIPNT